MNALREKYEKQVKSELKKEFGIKNDMAVPRIQKVVVNMGTGDLAKSKEAFAKLANELAAMTGQKPKIQAARISVAGFSLRAGQHVGLTVTLRSDRMYSFLQKLISVVLPRVRDFRGVPTKSFDKGGNYTLGFTEHSLFPEIDLAKVDKPHGMEITIVNNSGSPEIAKRLLELMGMPFEKEEE